MNEDWMDRLPKYDFVTPPFYEWLIAKGIIGFGDDSPLDPWHYHDGDCYEISEQWPRGPFNGRLVCFAMRSDNDDMYCFHVKEGAVCEIVHIHAWTSSGYDIVKTFHTFIEWVQYVIEEIGWMVDEQILED